MARTKEKPHRADIASGAIITREKNNLKNVACMNARTRICLRELRDALHERGVEPNDILSKQRGLRGVAKRAWSALFRRHVEEEVRAQAAVGG